MVNQERLLQLFLELVQIDSETGHERLICDALKEKLSALGLDVIEDDSAKKTGHQAGNIVATLAGNQAHVPPIYFTVHMDTVTPGKGVKPSIKDGYVITDGQTILGSDDKAGIAALLEALQIIKELRLTHGQIQLLITVGEESGLVGAKALQPDLLQADFGYALDSDGPVGDIIVGAPTQAKIKAGIYGKAAHAGVSPESGISAIQVAAKSIAKMSLGRIDSETTANIGSFHGGGPTNVVCDYVEILAEARSLDENKMKHQVQSMKEAFETVAQDYKTKADVQTEVMYPGFRFQSGDKVVDIAEEAIKSIGREPRLLTSGGGSDANIMAGLGIPTINLAIGYEEIHTKNERMPLSELYKAAELVIAIIKTISKLEGR
jgi:tripeptide aminopeptidase